MYKKVLHTALFFALLGNAPISFAQTNPEDIALEADSFQEAYYEALKQKAIENYDKAIISLEKCLDKQPENDVINHELGKNYFFMKQYPAAEKYFTKATQLVPKNKWYWIDLYEVYYQTKNYNQGIATLQRIIPLDAKYKEDLLALYMYSRQYDKALLLINELDETDGKTERRNLYRAEINRQTGSNAGNKNDLEKAITENPLNEENYLSLITKYSESNQEEKAREWIEKMQKNIPNSEWAQVFIFKYHINDGKGTEAYQALETVLKSRKLDKKIKIKMFNEFLIYVTKNPSFENQLTTATQYFEGDPEFDVYKEVGKFYYKKKQWDLAIKHLEKSVVAKKNDTESAIFLLASYEEKGNFTAIQKLAVDSIDLFPNQPEFYYFAGKANYQLKNFKKANEYLEIGLDYVVDNPDLEMDFLILMKEVALALGNAKKAEEYQIKATNLKNKKK